MLFGNEVGWVGFEPPHTRETSPNLLLFSTNVDLSRNFVLFELSYTVRLELP